jgi:hypothetical protein
VGPGDGLDAVKNTYFSLSGIELRFRGDSAFGPATIATEFNKRPVFNPRSVQVGSVVNKALSPRSSTFPCKLSLHQRFIFMLPGAGTICSFGSSEQTGRGISTMALGQFDRVWAPYPGGGGAAAFRKH